MYNEASKRATLRYQKEHLAQISLKVPKAEKERYMQAATEANMPLVAYIRAALEDKMDNNFSMKAMLDGVKREAAKQERIRLLVKYLQRGGTAIVAKELFCATDEDMAEAVKLANENT